MKFMDVLFRRAIDSELNQWGGWLERHADYEGFPGANILVAFTNGRGGGLPGHRVLCLDMPSAIYATHGRVLLLPENEREAVYLYFAFRLKPDGHSFWTVEEKCQVAGIDERTMRRRLSRARYRIAGLPVPSKKEIKQALQCATEA